MSSDSIIHDDVLSHVETYTKKGHLERLSDWYNKHSAFFGVTFLFAIACIPLTLLALMNRNFVLAILLTILSSITWLIIGVCCYDKTIDQSYYLIFIGLIFTFAPWFAFFFPFLLFII